MKSRFFLTLAVSSLFFGCSHKSDLSYVPHVSRIEPTTEAKKIYIDFHDFTDEREDKQQIATSYLYGIVPIGTISTEHNLAHWSSDLFKVALKRAGFTSKPTHLSHKKTYELKGRILNASTSDHQIYLISGTEHTTTLERTRYPIGHVTIELTAYENGKQVFQKTYTKSKSGRREPQLMSFPLERAINKIARRFINEFEQEILSSNP